MIDVTDGTAGSGYAGSLHDPIDVARLCQEGLLSGAEVIAGAGLLHNEVGWVLPWDQIGAGEAEGVGLVADARQLDSAGRAGLQSLAERGVSVVFVVGTTPTATDLLIDAPFPLVQMAPSVTFPALNRLVAELALSKQAHVLRYGLTVHQSLAELLYRGSGLSALGRQMSRLSGCPVVLLDPHGRRLAYEYEFSTPAPNPELVVAQLLETVPLVSITELTAHPWHSPRTVAFRIEDEPHIALVSPIVLGGRHDGWIVLIELVAEPSQHDLSRHQVVVEQATMIIGSEMLRLRSVEIAEERARGDFVHALLHGRLSNPHELIARAAHYDFDTGARYGVVVARQSGVAGSPESQARMQQLTRSAAALLARKGSPALLTVVGDVLAVVLQTEAGSLRRGSAQVQEFALALQHDLARLYDHPLTVAYGRPVSGAARIVESYREARVALGVCERLLIEDVSGYAELRVFAVLLELAGSQQGQAFAREVLEPLRQAARKSGGDLEQAVMAYVESGGNLNAAARTLSLHRNTMLYKLERASRALDLDLRKAENQFTVWLAHRVELLGDVQSTVSRELGPRS